jgi:hypothetical protein
VRLGVLERIKKDYYGSSPKKYCTEHTSLKEAEFGNILAKRLIQTAGHFAIWRRSGSVLVLLIGNFSIPNLLYPYACVVRKGLTKWEHYDIFSAQWDLEEETEKEKSSAVAD